jgi:hypothetical protein
MSDKILTILKLKAYLKKAFILSCIKAVKSVYCSFDKDYKNILVVSIYYYLYYLSDNFNDNQIIDYTYAIDYISDEMKIPVSIVHSVRGSDFTLDQILVSDTKLILIFDLYRKNIKFLGKLLYEEKGISEILYVSDLDNNWKELHFKREIVSYIAFYDVCIIDKIKNYKQIKNFVLNS